MTAGRAQAVGILLTLTWSLGFDQPVSRLLGFTVVLVVDVWEQMKGLPPDCLCLLMDSTVVELWLFSV